ncbi:patatin-like phospholipase family protein [Haloferula chungangensis]|uniref:Patatin-like phospholipase family protein n=1 Tax=Haloferula chungangensis TaxID=1048331 RepID=A0ABW2LA78_9BACT
MEATEKGLGVSLASSFFGHYAHCGFLCELEKAGVVPTRIAGASAGALAGGMWAAGLRGEQLLDEILSFGFRRSFFDFSAIWRLPGVLTWSYSPGILAGSRMERRLKGLFGEMKLEDLKEPKLELAVANVCKSIGELRSEGRLVDFIIASFSMPLVFCPRTINGERFLDGGISNETPYAHWLDDPTIDQILVHKIRIDDSSVGKGFMNPGKVISAIHAIPNAELEGYRRRHAEASGKEVIVLETEQINPGLLQSRNKGRALFEGGAATARKWLDSR